MAEAIRNSWKVLWITFGVLFIATGIDKFLNILTDWEMYVDPTFASMFSPSAFMVGVGIFEILLGIFIFWKPKAGGWLASIWLVLIAVNLAMLGTYDIAARDIILAISVGVMAGMSNEVRKKFV